MYFSMGIIFPKLEQEIDRQLKIRNFLELELETKFNAIVVGKEVNRLPNTTMAIFPNIKADQLITKIPGFAISTGSACTSANPQPSYVVSSLGFTSKQAESAIRISIGRQTAFEDVKKFIFALEQVFRQRN
jgi:cysteine desulfurase